MEPSVRAQYTDTVRAAVATAVGVTPEDMHDLGGFESFVHDVPISGRPTIVKATWGGRRTAEEVGAELHFVNYLADQGAPVCRALPLVDGSLVGTVPAEDGVFHVSAFAKAPGRVLRREDFTPEVFRAWGAMVGRLHRLSTRYPGPPAPLARPAWEVEVGSLADLVAHEPEAHARFIEVLERLETLARDRDTFGTMHTDLHRHNIHWHEGRMHVFDFEDAIEFWFVSDLAIVLYYAVLAPLDDADPQGCYDAWKGPLLDGYATEHALPAEALDTLPLFLSLREHTLRAVIVRSVPAAERSPWWAQYVERATARILSGEPALGLQA